MCSPHSDKENLNSSKRLKMKKNILILLTSLMSFNAAAGVCNNGSLIGPYNYEFSGVQPYQTNSGILTWSKHDVGRISFNGAGGVSFNGIETDLGRSITVSGSGSYSVLAWCAAFGTITTNRGAVITYWIYLDQMDNAPPVNVAYHATLAVKNNLN